MVYALYPNGNLQWHYQTGAGFNSSPALSDNGTIYIGNDDGKVYALNPDGSFKWSFQSGAGITNSSPTIGDDGTIYIGSSDYKIYAINTDGSLNWEYETEGEVFSSPAIADDGTIYLGSVDGKVYALYPDGSPKWSYQTGGKVESSPAIADDGTIYFGSVDGKVYALNHPDGTLKWHYQTASYIVSPPAIGNDGTIFIGSGRDDGNVYALNPDGSLRWKYQTGNGIWPTLAIGADGTVYGGNDDGNVFAINSDGSLKWSYQTGASVGPSSPAIGADGTVYIGNDDGNVYAFGDESSNVIYSSAWVYDPDTIYIVKHNQPPGEYQQSFDELTAQGYRLISIDSHVINNTPYYATIYVYDPDTGFMVKNGQSSTECQQSFDELTAQGYRLICLDSHVINNTPYYATIYICDPDTAFMVKRGQTFSQYQQTCDELADQGYRLISIDTHVLNDTPYYASAWVHDPGALSWSTYKHNASEYQQTFDELTAQGYRLLSIDSSAINDTPYYASAWLHDSGTEFRGTHNQTYSQYQQTFDELSAQGFRPLDIDTVILIPPDTEHTIKTFQTDVNGEVSFFDENIGKEITVKSLDENGHPLENQDILFLLDSYSVSLCVSDPYEKYTPLCYIGNLDELFSNESPGTIIGKYEDLNTKAGITLFSGNLYFESKYAEKNIEIEDWKKTVGGLSLFTPHQQSNDGDYIPLNITAPWCKLCDPISLVSNVSTIYSVIKGLLTTIKPEMIIPGHIAGAILTGACGLCSQDSYEIYEHKLHKNFITNLKYVLLFGGTSAALLYIVPAAIYYWETDLVDYIGVGEITLEMFLPQHDKPYPPVLPTDVVFIKATVKGDPHCEAIDLNDYFEGKWGETGGLVSDLNIEGLYDKSRSCNLWYPPLSCPRGTTCFYARFNAPCQEEEKFYNIYLNVTSPKTINPLTRVGSAEINIQVQTVHIYNIDGPTSVDPGEIVKHTATLQIPDGIDENLLSYTWTVIGGVINSGQGEKELSWTPSAEADQYTLTFEIRYNNCVIGSISKDGNINEPSTDCDDDGDCVDDGVFCNGPETCVGGTCQPSGDPCPGQKCDETNTRCVDCLGDGDCVDDGVFCNGPETCVGGTCQPSGDPCPGQVCDEGIPACLDCLVDGDCNDNDQCTTDSCVDGTCQYTPLDFSNGSIALLIDPWALGAELAAKVKGLPAGVTEKDLTYTWTAREKFDHIVMFESFNPALFDEYEIWIYPFHFRYHVENPKFRHLTCYIVDNLRSQLEQIKHCAFPCCEYHWTRSLIDDKTVEIIVTTEGDNIVCYDKLPIPEHPQFVSVEFIVEVRYHNCYIGSCSGTYTSDWPWGHEKTATNGFCLF